MRHNQLFPIYSTDGTWQCLGELSSASTRTHLEAIKMPIDDPDDEFQKELNALAVALLQ